MKKIQIIFIALFFLLCIIPLAGMAVYPTTQSVENRTPASFPKVTDSTGGINLKFFDQFSDFFSDHFAFRNELVYLDAKLQGDLLGTSSVPSVIRGSDGWLYYQASLKDYLGTDPMTERERYNWIRNLSLVADYLKNQDMDMLLMIPPNKNTLYGENMPYYDSLIVEPIHNLERIEPDLEKAGIPYVSLLQLFRETPGVFYLKRDSHWTNQGALMAYNRAMDELGLPHQDYAGAAVKRSATENGDLNRMLYTLYGQREMNEQYELSPSFAYKEGFASVEDNRIETSGGAGAFSLLMFRDSFGNALIPFFADQFREAFFTKESPYGLERLCQQMRPQVVIFEKAERNLRDFIITPPIISAPAAEADIQTAAIQASSAYEVIEEDSPSGSIQLESLMYDAGYWRIFGEINENFIDLQSNVIIKIGDQVYQAYHTGERGFELYLRKEAVSFPVSVEILVETQGQVSCLFRQRLLEENEK